MVAKGGWPFLTTPSSSESENLTLPPRNKGRPVAPLLDCRKNMAVDEYVSRVGRMDDNLNE